MFIKNMRSPQLCSETANNVFGRINGDHYDRDYSFVATMRALLLSRTKDENISFKLKTERYTANQLSMASEDAVFGLFNVCANRIIIYSSRCDLDEQDTEAINVLANVLKNKSYSEKIDLHEFCKERVDARFFINEGTKSTVILVPAMKMRQYHFLQSLIPRYLPWFFKATEFSELEIKLLKSLQNRYPVDYEKLIEEMAESLDLRKYSIVNLIGGFEKRSREEAYNNSKNELQSLQRRAADILSDYNDMMERIDEKNIVLAGLMAAINSAGDNSELCNFFIANKSLTPVMTDRSRFSFVVSTYIDNFDPEMYDTMSRRETSHLFSGYAASGVFESVEARKKFMDAVFSDEPKLRIKTCGYYQLGIDGTVTSYAGYHYPNNCDDRIPNPHLHNYNCLGNHARYIIERLQQHDLVGAVNQCIGSCKSVNIGESMTMQRFLRDIFDSTSKIIETMDGESMTPAEALAWLYEQEAK